MVPRNGLLSRNWIVAAGAILFAGLALCGFQFGDRYGMNSMPYAQVQPLVSDLAKARRMASEGNIELLAGETLKGHPVNLRGEVSDANCFLASHTHAYDHAFCAKLCVAAGSPLVFIPDQGERIYVVLSPQNAARLPDKVLDQIGVPGVAVQGRLVESNGMTGLAVDRIGR
jgi:hypothetical protein